MEPSVFLNLTKGIDAELRAVSVDLGHGRSATFYDLLVAWWRHVDRLQAEAVDPNVDARSAWNEHDYVAALFIRDRLQVGIGMLNGERLLGEASSAVDAIDVFFRSFTEPGPRDLFPLIAEVQVIDRGWWWGRVPQAGPVAAKLAHYRKQVPPSGQRD